MPSMNSNYLSNSMITFGPKAKIDKHAHRLQTGPLVLKHGPIRDEKKLLHPD